MPVILLFQEAEISKMDVQRQLWQIVFENLSQKYSPQKKGWWSGSSGRVPA
jgi:hypothetical protein